MTEVRSILFFLASSKFFNIVIRANKRGDRCAQHETLGLILLQRVSQRGHYDSLAYVPLHNLIGLKVQGSAGISLKGP